MKKQPINITVTTAEQTLDRPMAPIAPTPLDHAKHLEYAKQMAQQDHAAHLNDITWIQCYEGSLLPIEQEEQERLEAAKSEATLRIHNAEATAKAIGETADVNLLATGPTLPQPYTTTIANEKKVVDEIDKQIEEAEDARTAKENILKGAACDEEGIPWTGPIPARPTPDTTHHDITWSAANLRDKALTWLPYVVLGGMDLFIIVSNIKDYLRDDSYLKALVFSVALAAGQILLTAFIGHKLAEAYRRTSILAKDVLILIGASAFWLACVASSTAFRVMADRDEAIQKAAQAQHVTLDQVDPSTVYSVTSHVAIWTVTAGVIGVIVILLMVFYYNPVITQILKIDHNIVDLYLSRFVHKTVLSKGEACVKATIQAGKDAITELKHERDAILPKQSKEFCQRYRRCLDLEYGNSEATIALFPQNKASDTNTSAAVDSDDDIVDAEVLV